MPNIKVSIFFKSRKNWSRNNLTSKCGLALISRAWSSVANVFYEKRYLVELSGGVPVHSCPSALERLLNSGWLLR